MFYKNGREFTSKSNWRSWQRRQQRKRKKARMSSTQYIWDQVIVEIDKGGVNSLSQLKCTAPQTPCPPGPTPQRKKKMYDEYNPPRNLEAEARDHLIDRLYQIRGNRENDLYKKYGLRDESRPLTPREFLQRIADGKFTIPEDKMDKNMYNFGDVVRWRDPSVKEDMAGFRASETMLNKASDKVEDIIKVKTPAEGLTALQEFESATFN